MEKRKGVKGIHGRGNKVALLGLVVDRASSRWGNLLSQEIIINTSLSE